MINFQERLLHTVYEKNLLKIIRDLKENIFTGEVSFYIDDHINCHKCPILKAEHQNEFFNTRVTPKKAHNEKIPTLI